MAASYKFLSSHPTCRSEIFVQELFLPETRILYVRETPVLVNQFLLSDPKAHIALILNLILFPNPYHPYSYCKLNLV